jgi:hypothetical protein
VPAPHKILHAHLDVGQLDDLMGIIGARLGKRGLPAATGWGLDLGDLGWLQQDLAMPWVPSPGSWGTLRLAGVRRFHPWRIQAARTVGMAGVPLPLGLKGCYPCLDRAHPFCLLLNDRYQVDDQPPFSCSIAAQRLLAGDQVGHLPLQHSHLVLLLRHQRMRPLSTQRGQVFRSNHGRP